MSNNQISSQVTGQEIQPDAKNHRTISYETLRQHGGDVSTQTPSARNYKMSAAGLSQCQSKETAMTNDLISRAEAAKKLNLKPQTLAAWACSKSQNLPYIKCGSRVAYRQSDIDAFLAANTIGGI